MGLSNAELGLVLTTVAGSATALGAAVVFSERLVQLASKPFLAGALGLSSGVMLYVSFVEIFVKSLDGFADSSAFGDSDAYLMATAALFGGMAFMSGLDALVHWLDPNRSAHHASDPRKHMVRASRVLFFAVFASMAWVWRRDLPWTSQRTPSPRRVTRHATQADPAPDLAPCCELDDGVFDEISGDVLPRLQARRPPPTSPPKPMTRRRIKGWSPWA